MSLIRSLSGAPTPLGASSLDGGGGSRRRARSQTSDGDIDISSSLTSRTFSQMGTFGSIATDTGRSPRRWTFHHVAGEVIGSSYNSNQGLSPRKPRHSISCSYSTTDSPSKKSGSVPPTPPTKTPSPQAGPFPKIRSRSSTWDSSMGRSSPKFPSRSNTLDHRERGSPGSVASPAASAILQGLEGVDSGGTTNLAPEHGFVDLYVSESDDDSEESKREVEMDEMEAQTAEQHIEVIQEENSPRSDADSDINLPMNEIDETKRNNFRSIEPSNSMVKSGPAAKSVRFAEEMSDNVRGRRPSYAMKLPTITKWDENFEDEEEKSDYSSIFPTSWQNSNGGAHSQPQSSLPAPSLLAKLNPFGDLSWSIIGSCIVRTAPCFWCLKRPGTALTDRQILLRLNVLITFFCIVQICSGLFLFITKFLGYVSEDKNLQDKNKYLISAELWSLELFVYCLSAIALVLLLSSVLCRRAIKEVNLVVSVRLMWVLLWLLPTQIFFMIGLFDYDNVNRVKIKHWWDDPTFRMPREWFCPGTAHEQCKVPILGGIDYATEEEWCQHEYNSTDCKTIRDDAQAEFNFSATFFYTLNAIWALLLVVIMWTALCVLQAIISLPIVHRSKESRIPFWLTVPIVGCFIIGSLLHYYPTSLTEEVRDVYWIAVAYFTSGGAFTLAALVGYFLKFYTVLNGRQRRVKQLFVIVFIVTLVLTVFGVAAIFITSLIYTLSIVDHPLDQYNRIACGLDMSGSCTGCEDDSLPMCPEWEDKDVKLVLRTVMKQSAALAAIFLVYALIALRYGFVLFRYVSRYQIEYV